MEKIKKTIFMLPAVLIVLFAACSSEDAVIKDNTVQQNETPENAVGFSGYMNRSVTRAGWAGELTTLNGTKNLRTEGFGVFAYYADGELYSENATPNFMYNQFVNYSNGAWTYAPIKYWPNEFGSSAVSTGVDRVSFFAYAPYVGVDPASGMLTSYYDNTVGTGNDGSQYEKLTETGITWLTRNGKPGDPYVRYAGAFDPAKCVDLCYGVAASDFTSAVDGGDGINNVKSGKPYLNVAKPAKDATINFAFRHALAKLKVQVDADINIASHSGEDTYPAESGENKNMTRVWVRSITFDGIAPRGYLNLNTGNWYEVMDNNKISHASVTIFDGQRDGAEALSKDTYEVPTGFNPDLIQSSAYTKTSGTAANGTPVYTDLTTTQTGVTTGYKNLFAGNGELLVIPANEQLKVTIVYDVETADAILANYLSDGVTKGSTIENKITKTITYGGLPLKLEPGKGYTLNLHLGLNSVDFTADVGGWDDSQATDEPWLPANAPRFAANSTNSFTVACDATKIPTFTVFGLTNTSGVAASTLNSSIVTTVPTLSAATVPTSGEISTTDGGTIAANETVSRVTTEDAVKITETGAGSSVTHITLIQEPKPFVHGLTAISAGNTITITAGATSGTVNSTQWNAAVVTIKKKANDGSEWITLTKVADSPTGNQFKYDGNTDKGTVTLGTPAVAGDKFIVTVQVGNAPAVSTSEITVQ